MDLKGIMLGEISQRNIGTVWYHLYVNYKKYNSLVNETNKQKSRHAHIENKLVVSSGVGGKRLIIELYEIICVKSLKL